MCNAPGRRRRSARVTPRCSPRRGELRPATLSSCNRDDGPSTQHGAAGQVPHHRSPKRIFRLHIYPGKQPSLKATDQPQRRMGAAAGEATVPPEGPPRGRLQPAQTPPRARNAFIASPTTHLLAPQYQHSPPRSSSTARGELLMKVSKAKAHPRVPQPFGNTVVNLCIRKRCSGTEDNSVIGWSPGHPKRHGSRE